MAQWSLVVTARRCFARLTAGRDAPPLRLLKVDS